MTELRVEDRGAVRWLTIDRPESRNGLTAELVYRMLDAFPGDHRVLVLTGANGAFCSGADLKAGRDALLDRSVEKDLREGFQRLIRALTDAPQPTIAFVDGIAAGFGCDLAFACDLRVASDRTAFAEIFVTRGLMPDGGGTWLLPRIVGLGRALEMLYTGRRIEVDEAERIGLAIRTDIDALAQRLAAGPPLALRAIKHAVYTSLDSDLAAALDREARGQMQLLSSEDFREGITAFLQKRDPAFRGR